MSNGGSYDPHAVESKIYEFWEQGGFFHAEPNPDKEPFVIDIPLPNVTGALHLGHALNDSLQDILIRHKRMCGYEAMWMPGTDHAGIATQAVVERKLKEEQNLTRHELKREGLVKKIWEWKEEYGGRILMQLHKMGFSCDWERTRFTLDEVCAKAVYEVFFQWFKAGLIYRGLRLVNWDAYLQTAVADDEIIHETVKSHLWHYRYPILREEDVAPGLRPGRTHRLEAGATQDVAPGLRPGRTHRLEAGATQDVAAGPLKKNVAAGLRTGRRLPGDVVQAALARAAREDAKMGADYLAIATTRPETMLGDTAVAVHPNDERYKHLIGRYCLLPLANRTIPIIADPILVKREFGTGCVKVTPGHDPNDYACGQRQKLEMINILTTDGHVREEERFAPYGGMDRDAARDKVVEDLEALGLMEQIEDYEHEVGHSDRSKTPIEPMLSEQWFMKMGDLAESAMDAVRDGRVQFFPARYAKTYLDWLGEKRDWCISRQLWWGHRIPVWSRPIFPLDEEPKHYDSRRWAIKNIKGLSEEQNRAVEYQVEPAPDQGMLILHVCVKPNRSDIVEILEKDGFERDEDVLDTWFSSALWPFSTLGWPHDQNPERERAGHQNPERERAGHQNPERERGGQGEREHAAKTGPVAHAPGTDDTLPTRAGTGPVAHALGTDIALPTRADLDYFYPTSVLVTGREIITLWVARMVMTGLYFLGRVPFQHVFIHPNIQDGQGRRMSKSLGNGVDPVDIIELYGTDALRFTMAQMATETQDARMPVKKTKMPDGREVNTSDKFELGRNFCNKIWQASTGFVLANLEPCGTGIEPCGTGILPVSDENHRQDAGATRKWPRPLKPEELNTEDRWILSRLGGAIADLDRRFARYQINEVTNTLYTFFWSDFCDWYVELVKPRLFGKDDSGKVAPRSDESAGVARQVLAHVLDQTLRLMQPVIPFITEELWRRLREKAPQRGITDIKPAEETLITAAWPDAAAHPRDPQIEREIEALQNVIRALRDTLARINTSRSATKTPAIGKLPRAVIRADEGIAAGLAEQIAVLQRLGRCERIEVGSDVAKPPESATQVLAGVEVYVPLSGLMDLAAERKRLQKERDNLRGHIERLTGKLANEGFVSKAPAAVVEKERQRLAEMKDRLALLERNLADIEA